MSKRVPFFNYPYLFGHDKDKIMSILGDVIDRGAYILQKDLLEFEERLKDYLKVSYAFGVADGTNAIILSLLAADIGPGDEVILPSHTYIATAASVHFVGAKPVLAECASDHMLDTADIEKRITNKTKAIIPVHINGRTCDMDEIIGIAHKYNLKIVEDSAQALGSRYNGKFAGTFGIAGTFSFYPAKVLGCLGDGGAVVTNSSAIADKISMLRDHGRNSSGQVVMWGTNSRLDNIQAAVLAYRILLHEEEIARRREIASMYNEGLSVIDMLDLPPPPKVDDKYFDIYQNYEIEADYRDDLKQYLADNNVGTLIQWSGKAVHQLSGLGFDDVQLPKTDRLFQRCLMLPMNTSLSDQDVNYVINCVQEFYDKKAG